MCEYAFHVYVTCASVRVCTPACDNSVRLGRSKWRRGTSVELKVHYKKSYSFVEGLCTLTGLNQTLTRKKNKTFNHFQLVHGKMNQS